MCIGHEQNDTKIEIDESVFDMNSTFKKVRIKAVSIATFSSAALVPKSGSQLDETLLINSNDVRTVKSSQET